MKALADVKEVTIRYGRSWRETRVLFDGQEQSDIVEIRITRIAPHFDSDRTASPGEHGAGVLVEQRTVQAGG